MTAKNLRLTLCGSLALFIGQSLSVALINLPAHGTGVAMMKLDVTSPAFHNGQAIPKQYTADGKNVSPPIKWNSLPAGTKSVAVICDDPDAPVGTWVHWVVYGIPGTAGGLDEAIPPEKVLTNGARQGTNSFHKVGYGGPSPPPGKPHRYFFKVYALDVDLTKESQATAKQIEEAVAGHTLGEGQLMGTYGR